jgi:hypothetical protein
MRYESSRLADAALIAEAGTVTNQTGRTPAELASLVRELRGALDLVFEQRFDDDGIGSATWHLIADTLAKSEGA